MDDTSINVVIVQYLDGSDADFVIDKAEAAELIGQVRADTSVKSYQVFEVEAETWNKCYKYSWPE